MQSAKAYEGTHSFSQSQWLGGLQDAELGISSFRVSRDISRDCTHIEACLGLDGQLARWLT